MGLRCVLLARLVPMLQTPDHHCAPSVLPGSFQAPGPRHAHCVLLAAIQQVDLLAVSGVLWVSMPTPLDRRPAKCAQLVHTLRSRDPERVQSALLDSILDLDGALVPYVVLIRIRHRVLVHAHRVPSARIRTQDHLRVHKACVRCLQSVT
jgi:hypothetical protein